MKKFLALVLVLLMIVSIASCTKNAGTKAPEDNKPATTTDKPKDVVKTAVEIKVWAAQEDQDFVRGVADKFIAANTEFDITINLGVVGENDAYNTFSDDPEAAADVFSFAHDQLKAFVDAGGLYEVSRNKDDVVKRNVEGSIEAASMDGKLYAYPATADNGYFLYYDKSVLSEEDVKTLDKILEVSNAAGKRVLMHLDGNAWYVASFFFGAGNTLSLSADGKQVCEWNNASGLAAAQAMQEFCKNPAYLNGDDGVLKGGIGGTISCGVSGTWNAADISEILGDNYGACKLPTFTMNGKQTQMGSFAGYKLIGVNSMITDPDKLVVAMDFADFLTNEENQIARFKARMLGPSNIVAASDPAVKADIALSALADQSLYATAQKDINNDTFWPPVGAFGTAMVNKDTTDLQKLLDNMVEQVTA